MDDARLQLEQEFRVEIIIFRFVDVFAGEAADGAEIVPQREHFEMRDAIAAANVKGVTGQLKMNADRNVIKPAVIEEIQFVNGDVKYAYKTTINPN